MLRGAGPREAVRILRSVPPERVSVLLTEMETAEVARLIVAAGGDQTADMLRSVPAERFAPIIRCMSMRELANLVGAVPPELAARCLEAVTARAAVEVISELPEPDQARLVDLIEAQHRGDVSQALYERNAQESVVRIATRVSWLNQATCDLLAVAMNQTFQVAVRHRRVPPFTLDDIDSVLSTAAWATIAGLIVLTNVPPDTNADQRLRQVRSSGRLVDVLRWTDRRDDGTLKRTIVRMVG